MRFEELQITGQKIFRRCSTVRPRQVTLLIGILAFASIGSGNMHSIIDDERQFDFNFSIKDLSDKKLSFEEFKGKVVFLNLWATWCKPCRAEMPGIQKLYERSDKDKVVFVMLSIDRDSDKAKVVEYLRSKELTFPAYLPSGSLPEQLKVPSIPTTFIIARNGMVARKEVGKMNYDSSTFDKYLIELSQQSH